MEDYRGNSFWFMRTSGYTPRNVTYICDFGYVYSRGTTVTTDDAGILPAIRIDLSEAAFEYAGEISSVEVIMEPVVPEAAEVFAAEEEEEGAAVTDAEPVEAEELPEEAFTPPAARYCAVSASVRGRKNSSVT